MCVCVCVRIYLCVCALTDNKVVPVSWLLQIIVQLTWAYRYLFVITILFPLGLCPEVGLLDYMVIPFLIYGETSPLFSIVAVPTRKGFLFSTRGPAFGRSFKGTAILTGVEWHLGVAPIFISLMTGAAAHLFWPFLHLPLRNTYSSLLSILLVGLFIS